MTPCRNEPEDGDITSLHAKRNLITVSDTRKETSRESIALIGKAPIINEFGVSKKKICQSKYESFIMILSERYLL